MLCQRRRLTRSTLALVSIVDMVYLLLLLILGFLLVPVCQMLRKTFCKKKSLEKAINIWYWTRIQRQLLLIPLYPIRYMQACCPSWPGSQACNHGLHLCLVWTFPPQWLMRLRCYFSRTGVRYEVHGLLSENDWILSKKATDDLEEFVVWDKIIDGNFPCVPLLGIIQSCYRLLLWLVLRSLHLVHGVRISSPR